MFAQAQQLLVHPLSHALLALIMFCTSIFALMRAYAKASRRLPLFFAGGSVVVLAGTAAQLVLLTRDELPRLLTRDELPRLWPVGRDLPVYLLIALAIGFGVLGVRELKARRSWQGYTNLMQAFGTLALAAGILKYAYSWHINLASVLVLLMLLVMLSMACAAMAMNDRTGGLRPVHQQWR